MESREQPIYALRPGGQRRQAGPTVSAIGNRLRARSPRHADAARCPTAREVCEERQAGRARTWRPVPSGAARAGRAATVRHEARARQHDRRRRDARAAREHIVTVREPDRPGSDRARAAASISTSSGRPTARAAARRAPGVPASDDRSRYAVDLHRGAGTARVEVGVDAGTGGPSSSSTTSSRRLRTSRRRERELLECRLQSQTWSPGRTTLEQARRA